MTRVAIRLALSATDGRDWEVEESALNSLLALTRAMDALYKCVGNDVVLPDKQEFILLTRGYVASILPLEKGSVRPYIADDLRLVIFVTPAESYDLNELRSRPALFGAGRIHEMWELDNIAIVHYAPNDSRLEGITNYYVWVRGEIRGTTGSLMRALTLGLAYLEHPLGDAEILANAINRMLQL